MRKKVVEKTPTAPSVPPVLLTTAEAAQLLGSTVGTLEVWRCTKRYPLPYVKIGTKVRYRMQDVAQFIESRVQNRLERVAS